MILAVDDVMKLPEFAVQNEKVIEEKLNAAELMIRAYTNNNFQNRFVRFTADSLGNRLLRTSDFLKVGDTVQISQSMVNDGLYTITEIGDDFIRVNQELYKSTNLITITVDCDVEPYKIETNSASEPWLWDVFSFVNGIIHVNEVKVSGSKKVNLINRVKIVSPTFTCSTAMKVTHEGNTYSLPAGETTVYDIRLQEGDNYVTFTGNGTVKISYRGGSL